MKRFNLLVVLSALLLLASTALAGSVTTWWPRIGQTKALDALACAVSPHAKSSNDMNCTAFSQTYAECSFLSVWGMRETWRLTGDYVSGGNLWQGVIVRTSPSCSGFLCGFLAQVWWDSRTATPLVGVARIYDYQWTASGRTGRCEVTVNQSGVRRGTFYGDAF